MMKNIHIVIGAHYGDEGKGQTVHNICKKLDSSMVIRFNSGAQAGHTVEENNHRHVFSHVGAGSFNVNSQTYLSEYFVLNAKLFKKEIQQLKLLGFSPKISLSSKSLITTAYDVFINQAIERKRSKEKHGSCGLGFGETIERSLHDEFKIDASLIHDEALLIKQLKHIQNHYFIARLEKLNIDLSILNDFSFLLDENFNIVLAQEIIEAYDGIEQKEFDSIYQENEHLIFEGAQGLLLDQDMGAFPYVTRSNTGMKNIVSLLQNYTEDKLNIHYATRPYITRHGAGPLENELNEKPYARIVDKTNIPNDYQDHLRFAYANFDLTYDTIKKDLKSIQSHQYDYDLSISCLDQIDSHVIAYVENNMEYIKKEEFTNYFNYYLNVSRY
jgi:adenylosuccinate synthase